MLFLDEDNFIRKYEANENPLNVEFLLTIFTLKNLNGKEKYKDLLQRFPIQRLKGQL
jgi:hypothetical protein